MTGTYEEEAATLVEAIAASMPTYAERLAPMATVGDLIQAVYDHPVGVVGPFLISRHLYDRAESMCIDLTGFAPVEPPPVERAVSVDMDTGEMLLVRLDREVAPRPRNRAERRADARAAR